MAKKTNEPKVTENIKDKATKKKKTTSSTATKTTSKKTTKTTTTTSSAKKATTKASAKTTKSSSTKKASVKPKSTKKASAKTKTTTRTTRKKAEPINLIEYYDLPYRYNQTIVKILAQTPKMLFVYWDISDSDRKKYEEHYGSNFFNNSRPVLIIHNDTMNYSFELEINDFANSWYIHVNDANCKYSVELGRRPNRYMSELKEPYVYISSSNHLDFPNDHILFEKATPSVKYRNVKTNQISIKDFNNSTFVKNFMKLYNINTIEELYEKLYSSELLEEFKGGYYNNPSSNSFNN